MRQSKEWRPSAGNGVIRTWAHRMLQTGRTNHDSRCITSTKILYRSTLNNLLIKRPESISLNNCCITFTPYHLLFAVMSVASNATLFTTPDTYLGIYNELSKYNVHLNVFERLWAVSKCFDRHIAQANNQCRVGTRICKMMFSLLVS